MVNFIFSLKILSITPVGLDPDSKPIKENRFPYPPSVPLVLAALGPAFNSMVMGLTVTTGFEADINAFFAISSHALKI